MHQLARTPHLSLPVARDASTRLFASLLWQIHQLLLRKITQIFFEAFCCIAVYESLVRRANNKTWLATSTVDAHDVEVSALMLVCIGKYAPWERLPVNGRCCRHGITSGFLVANGKCVDRSWIPCNGTLIKSMTYCSQACARFTAILLRMYTLPSSLVHAAHNWVPVSVLIFPQHGPRSKVFFLS